ncbi:MAG: zinc metalloprotease HtpX [Candidatus Omnitrophota bacterium]|nr:zinc metalloprotease HtpX [Candidatus Omnitrophota bacterium]
MNTLKTAFFLTLLTLLFLVVGGLLGGRQGMMMAIILALAVNLGSYWFSDKIVLAMFRARPVTEAEAPELFGAVRHLAQLSNIPCPKVYIIPSEAPNAFATGRSPKHAAVAATEGILKILNQDELIGVMAHELSHVRNQDILIGTITAAIAGAIYMLIDMARWSFMFGGGNRDDRERGGGALNVAAFLVISILAPLIAMLIQMAVSRSREYQADESGARLCRKPLALASALEKIHAVSVRRPLEGANPATAHLFIINPFSAQGMTRLFSTHPPVEKRVEILHQLARQL